MRVPLQAGEGNEHRILSIAVSMQNGPMISSVQFNSVTQPCQALCGPVDCSIPHLPVHHSIESVMPSNHLILCRPLLLPSNLSHKQGLFK